MLDHQNPDDQKAVAAYLVEGIEDKELLDRVLADLELGYPETLPSLEPVELPEPPADQPEPAAAGDRCICGHLRSEHAGHTTEEGEVQPAGCSAIEGDDVCPCEGFKLAVTEAVAIDSAVVLEEGELRARS